MCLKSDTNDFSFIKFSIFIRLVNPKKYSLQALNAFKLITIFIKRNKPLEACINFAT